MQARTQTEIQDLEQQLIQSHKRQRRKEEELIVTNIKDNPKFFFSYARKRLKGSTPIEPLVKDTGEVVSSPKEMTQMFQSQYDSVYTSPIKNKEVTDLVYFFH